YPKRLFNYKSPVEMLKLANFNLKFGPSEIITTNLFNRNVF
ncbi:IS30 family transposase, partial [Streptococcus pyogenes]